MIVLDTSALAAILFDEDDALSFLERLESAEQSWMSSLNHYEAQLVAFGRKGAIGLKALDALVMANEVNFAPFDEQQRAIALVAHQRYGKGRGHPAQLNMSDCAAYALASDLRLPLLYKGQDFARTDIVPAW